MNMKAFVPFALIGLLFASPAAPTQAQGVADEQPQQDGEHHHAADSHDHHAITKKQVKEGESL